MYHPFYGAQTLPTQAVKGPSHLRVKGPTDPHLTVPMTTSPPERNDHLPTHPDMRVALPREEMSHLREHKQEGGMPAHLTLLCFLLLIIAIENGIIMCQHWLPK